ncbi:TVA12 protein, partial [Trogon melanurus]|nr:TVA12 protein [Trogon melanurus]
MGQTTVTQQEAKVLVQQREAFQTSCTYQTYSFNGLLWYQLKKGQAPQLISYQAASGSRPSGRFTTFLNT